jgi:catechol 1,2-dioxygenase
MKRREFIKNSSFVAFSISAFGFTRWNGKGFTGSTPTTSDILGPFYRPGAPFRNNLIPAGSTGMPLHFGGTIFKDDGSTPLRNALVEIWQCDENKIYDNTSDDFRFRGALKTGKDGRYSFKTIVPVPYKADAADESSWRPAHIHMRVSSESQQDLITQIYLKDGAYIDKDSSASSPDAVNRILPVTTNAAKESVITFDVVMSKEFPLAKEVYQKITGLYEVDKEIFEFVQNDDLLLMKRNGQIVSAIKYTGNNSFEGAMGSPKVRFELLASGGASVTIKYRTTQLTGGKFLKY